MRKHVFRVLVLLAFVFLSACAGSREAAEPEVVTGSDRDRLAGLAETEDFDATPYSDAPPSLPEEVEHDVPAELMTARTAPPARRSGRGFRIQVLSTPSKQNADAQVNTLVSWWQGQQGTGGSGGLFQGTNPPVYTVYKQPYYRVRVGNFANRSQAQQALSVVTQRFPGSIIVPDTVVR